MALLCMLPHYLSRVCDGQASTTKVQKCVVEFKRAAILEIVDTISARI